MKWVLLGALCATALSAQTAPPAPPPQATPVIGGFEPWPKADAEVVARGKLAYNTNCAYCHGEDARGGENGGTNLIRSDVFMRDRSGEIVSEFLKTTTSNEHKFRFEDPQVAEIAAFVHAFGINSRDPGRMRPPSILVGDAAAGQAYFNSKCASCHSATGDLKGLSSRITEPRSLQQTWLMPVVPSPRINPNSPYQPITVTVIMPDGKKIEGRLGRIDDFVVTLTEADGRSRTIRREGDVPKVDLHNPMQGHLNLLSVYTDRDIQNVTAYLVTLK